MPIIILDYQYLTSYDCLLPTAYCLLISMHYLQAIANLDKLKAQVSTIAGNEMVNFALDNIKASSWHGKPYKPRSPKAKRNRGRKLLVDTGDGKRSITFKVSGNKVIFEAIDYMVYNNEGFKGTVRVDGHKRATYDTVKVGTGTFSIKTKKERTRSARVARVARGDVKAHTRQMNLPERRFFGKSNVLESRINKLLANKIIKAIS